MCDNIPLPFSVLSVIFVTFDIKNIYWCCSCFYNVMLCILLLLFPITCLLFAPVADFSKSDYLYILVIWIFRLAFSHFISFMLLFLVFLWCASVAYVADLVSNYLFVMLYFCFFAFWLFVHCSLLGSLVFLLSLI